MAVRHTSLKCWIKLHDGIYRGSKITIAGRIPPDAQRFSINLQCGPGNSDAEDIAFHLNPRFTTMQVFRNTFTRNQWGFEEVCGIMPLSRGAAFEAVIECDQLCFKVSFNGKFFCSFVHRLPYTRITHVLVHGDVNLRQVIL